MQAENKKLWDRRKSEVHKDAEKVTDENQKEESWRKASRLLMLVEYRQAKQAESHRTMTKTKKLNL